MAVRRAELDEEIAVGIIVAADNRREGAEVERLELSVVVVLARAG